jgi:2-keto-4-pentenoate hydratase/2-oxohepta-3-ene-1,7-dioic acid hydratase in catechol pathway
MRLARFRRDERIGIGVVIGDELVDLARAEPSLPVDLVELFAKDAVALAGEVAERATERIALDQIELLCPIPRPGTFLAIGHNYADHIAETGAKPPEFPVFFNKQVSCVTGPFDPIEIPRASEAVDYEGELALVIGKRCRHVPRERAAEVIAGYLVCDDVSARDWQFRSPTMTLGKSFDTHGPIGPWVVTPDEVGDPHDLGLKTWVNGELRQDANTSQMIFDCFDQIVTLSTVMTLQPGDLVSTGTPQGVGIAMDPPGLLSVGDVVRIEIDGVGTIENPVIAEP